VFRTALLLISRGGFRRLPQAARLVHDVGRLNSTVHLPTLFAIELQSRTVAKQGKLALSSPIQLTVMEIHAGMAKFHSLFCEERLTLVAQTGVRDRPPLPTGC
jgi:hypothetical protein